MSDTNIPETVKAAGDTANTAPSQSDITGKKIFFVYPTAYIQNQVVEELVQHEYEVYVSKDPKRLAHALKKYSDSVIFANIDEGLHESEWEKWIHTLVTALPNIRVGVFSSSSDDKIREKYLNTLHIKCGFFNSKLDMGKTINKILEVFDAMNVKGRRKYLRANTEIESVATINMPLNSGFVNGIVRDVSVVGVSCSFEDDIPLHKNALVKDIQIRLQTMLLKAEAVVFGSRLDGHERIFVMLFTQRIDPEVKIKIRKYIQQNLQHKIDPEIN
ncbi:MAG: pilus assembly protein PilZ [Treponema sp.]|jgi:hypothetical protein|nr:pilus assembly protein PilZ [Treponema sp.]